MNAVFDLVRFTRHIEASLAQWVPAVVERAAALLKTGRLGLGPVERSDVFAVDAVLTDRSARGLQALWSSELQALLHKVPLAQDARQPSPHPSMPLGDGPLALSLKDEQEVDEDVELSHLMQNLESQAESALRDLRALCSALRGWQDVRSEAPPLHPQALAKTLGDVARQLPLTAAARLVLLRVWVTATSEVLPQVYQRQLLLLKSEGVAPAKFQVRLTMAAARREGGGLEPTEAPSVAAAAAAVADLADVAANPTSQVQAVLQHLLEAAGHTEDRPGDGAHGPVMDDWMTHIIQAVQQQAGAAPRMRQVFDQLTDPGLRLARAEPQLWRQPEHVWWQLLDRLLALCAVLDAEHGGKQDQLAGRCDAAVTRLCTEEPLNSTLCRAVLEEIDAAGSAVIQHHDDAVQPDAGGADHTIGTVVREQLMQQLRTSTAPSSVRRFLLGPWLRVLETSLDPARGDPDQAMRFTDWVDALLAALRKATAPHDVEALLAVAREGLTSVGTAPVQIDTWLRDLALRLREVAQAQAQPRASWRHEDLPTVPVALHGSVHSARAKRDRIAWIRGLRVGDICRLFVETAWCTAQLVKTPETGTQGDEVYIFQSRRPHCQHVLTLRALERLRDEGLATSVESGAFIAHALDTMAAQLADPETVHRG